MTHKSDPQFEEARRRYLEQKFPGDLADLIPAQAPDVPAKKSKSNTTRSWWLAIAAALLLGISMTYVAMQNLGRNGNNVAKTKEVQPAYIAKPTTKSPVQFSNRIDIRLTSSSTPKQATISFKRNKKTRVRSTSLSAKSNTKPASLLTFKPLRFTYKSSQPINKQTQGVANSRKASDLQDASGGNSSQFIMQTYRKRFSVRGSTSQSALRKRYKARMNRRFQPIKLITYRTNT